MEIKAIAPLAPVSLISGSTGTAETKEVGGTSFQDFLSNALNQVNEMQQEAYTATQQLATGEISDIHQVMIASEKASLAMQLTVQLRNKVLDAYQEIMRMQV